jgi:predicted regulator of Ras-like GTPase activity (Roadblock/LC7/MglB family)
LSPSDPFGAALAQLQEVCPQISGAVLSTSEGLILAATGELSSDAAAASAVHLAEQLDRSLMLLSGTGCDVMLVWSEAAVWCLARLSGQCALMARAGADCPAGALKLAVEHVGRELVPWLAGLGALSGAA